MSRQLVSVPALSLYYRCLVWFGLHPLAVVVGARRPVLLVALVSVASLSPLAPMLACVSVGCWGEFGLGGLVSLLPSLPSGRDRSVGIVGCF